MSSLCYFKERQGYNAVRYLFEMTSGLHSLILGEDQILAQVKKAQDTARSIGCCDNVLEVLFRSAITAAKKVKTQLSLSTANASAVEFAIARLKKDGMDFAQKKCLVIGNGEMGKRAANALQALGADVTVTVRQYRSGIVEIPDNCSRIDYGRRFEVLPHCDIIVSATSSPNLTIQKADIENCEISGKKIFIDLAVPRDIASNIRELPHVTLFDIDDFPAVQTDELLSQTERAKDLLHEEEEKYVSWYECRDLIPLTGKLAQYMANETDLRVGSLVKKIGLSQQQNEELTDAIDKAAGNVLRKMLFAVRDNAGTDVFRECLQAMEKVCCDEQS